MWIEGVLVRLLLVTLGIAASAGTAGASDRSLPLAGAGAFHEVYLDEPEPASLRGSTVSPNIVGIRAESPSRRFNVSELAVMLGPRLANLNTLCMKFISRDGKYFARGRYRWDATDASVTSIEFPSKYLDKITEYKTRDMAVSAFSSTSCDERRASNYFAVTYDRAAPPKKLVIQLQAGDARVRAQLRSDRNDALGPAVLCDKLNDGPAIAFTTECVLPLPSVVHSGNYRLSIGETASTGEITVKSYSVMLLANDDPRKE